MLFCLNYPEWLLISSVKFHPQEAGCFPEACTQQIRAEGKEWLQGKRNKIRKTVKVSRNKEMFYFWNKASVYRWGNWPALGQQHIVHIWYFVKTGNWRRPHSKGDWKNDLAGKSTYNSPQSLCPSPFLFLATYHFGMPPFAHPTCSPYLLNTVSCDLCPPAVPGENNLASHTLGPRSSLVRFLF